MISAFERCRVDFVTLSSTMGGFLPIVALAHLVKEAVT